VRSKSFADTNDRGCNWKAGPTGYPEHVPSLRREHGIDMVIANGENTAGGFGLTLDTAHELLDNGVDVLTSGNHIWDQKEIIPYLEEGLPLVRPANYPDAPGRGMLIHNDVMVVNLMGRVFMPPLDCPFRAADRILGEDRPSGTPSVIIVDFHAEATSLKNRPWLVPGWAGKRRGRHTYSRGHS
jgi:calcineurin-like phosphoesterase